MFLVGVSGRLAELMGGVRGKDVLNVYIVLGIESWELVSVRWELLGTRTVVTVETRFRHGQCGSRRRFVGLKP